MTHTTARQWRAVRAGGPETWELAEVEVPAPAPER